MKKTSYVYAAIATAIIIFILTRFGHFVIDGSSVWMEGNWLRLLFPVYGFVLFGYKTFLEWKKGGWTGWEYVNGVPKHTEDGKQVKVWQASYFVFTVICFLAIVAVMIGTISDR